MDNSLVSIIIPIYNVEQYLDRCIKSVINQTYKNIEIILVDDGSTDKCPEICDQYAQKDNRIVVIHKENGGLSSARNAGMKVLKGEYMLFVDSDDWIKENTVEELLQIAIEHDVDFVRFTPVTANHPQKEDGTPVDFGTEDFMENGIYDREKIRKDIFPRLFVTSQLTMGPIVAAWRSLYKSKFLLDNNLYFYEDIKYSEDAIFSARVVYNCEKFYYLKGGYYYNYFYNSNSITKSFKKDRWDVCKKLSIRFKEDFEHKKDYDFTNQIYLEDIYNVLNALGQRKCLNSLSDRYKYIKNIFDDEFTKKGMKHINLVESNLKMNIMLKLIKYRLAALYAVLI